jgi:uncharacterized protein (DUF2267 family)
MEYGTFLDRVSARAGLSPELAERLTPAVLRTLAEHIDAGEADDLAGLLPEQLRGYLVKERISAESFALPEFVQRVALRADVNPSRAEDAVRAVLGILHEAVGDAEWADLMAQLPLDFRELVEAAPGRGQRRPPAGGG